MHERSKRHAHTGLHLELSKELLICTLGIPVVHGEDNTLWIMSILSHFPDIFLQLPSVFRWSSLTQLESSNIGDLIFVTLDIYYNTQGGKVDRSFLPQHNYKLKLPVCLYDKYLARYTFPKNFEGSSSRSITSEPRGICEIFPPLLPYKVVISEIKNNEKV